MDSKKCRSKSGKKKDGFIVFCSQGAETEKAVKGGQNGAESNYFESNHLSVVPVAPFHAADHLNP